MSHQLLSKRIGEVGVGYGIYFRIREYPDALLSGMPARQKLRRQAIAGGRRKIKRHPFSQRETPPFYGRGGCHYPVPVHKQKPFKSYSEQKLSVAEKAAQEVLSLPVHPDLTIKDMETIVKALI